MITLAQHQGPRASQADACRAFALKGCTVAIVCDGVGSRGGPAAHACLDTVEEQIRRRSRSLVSGRWSKIDDVLHGAIGAACRDVRAMPGRLGTTLLVSVVFTGGFVLAHVGDSRAWHHSFGALRPLVQPHGLRNIIRSDVPLAFQIDIIHRDLDPDQDGAGLLVLASDGLDEPNGETAAEMVQAQIAAGARDNVTAVVIPVHPFSLDAEIGALVTLP